MNRKKLTTIAKRLSWALSWHEVTRIGWRTRFVERLRDVTPHRLALCLVSTLASQRVETIADLLRAFNRLAGTSVQYKPFHNQLSKPSFPRFMEGVFKHLLEQLVLRVLKPVPGSILGQFDDIVIQDGSSFAVKDVLHEQFPGRFKTVSPAAVEIHATTSVRNDQVLRVAIAPDTQGERDFLPEPEALAQKLLLADRGYDGVKYCSRVVSAGGSFLIRFKASMNPTVLEVRVGERRRRKLAGTKFQEVVVALQKRDADLDVVWTRRGKVFRARVILFWNHKTKKHVILVTNLARETFTVDTIATLYRLRWQIELMFKEWKSYANLHAFDTSKPQIAEGLIWAGLAAALVKRFLAHAVEYAYGTQAISTRRTAMALGSHMTALAEALLRAKALGRVLRDTLEFLSVNARRAHPKRDRERGRLNGGLQHAMVTTATP